jgi:hypothetical protein
MVDDELAADPELDASESRKAHRNSQLYQASNADKLMETELTKLRGESAVFTGALFTRLETDAMFRVESEEVDDDAVADALEDSEFSDGGAEGTTVFDPSSLEPNSTAAYYSTYSSNGFSAAQPRSPGLPSSPRPGAIFEPSSGQITSAR